MTPKISVIISTYNRKDFLTKAVQSVLDQTYQDFEIIIVDDASSDGSAESIAEIKDERIKYFTRADNFGNDTRPKNEGILYSTAPYIAFLDDDCTYRPDHLAILLKNLEENPDIDVVYGDRMVINGDDGKFINIGVFSDFDPFRLMESNYIDTSDVLVKREALFYVGGFDEQIKKFIDWNLWVRLAKAGYKFKRIPIVITNYTVHKDMKSQRVPSMEMTFNPRDCYIQLGYLGGEPAEPSVAVFSITYDRKELTEECFETLYQTAQHAFDHFIVDNGSKDGTEEYLDKLNNPNGQVHIIYNGQNKGISIASNQAVTAIKQAEKYDIIVKVDNDAYFKTEGWLKAMVDIWKRTRMVALSCYITGLRDNPGGAPREVYGYIGSELVGMTRHIGGITNFVDARAYDEWQWDEDAPLHGMQDVEFSQFITSKGYQMGYLENYYCEHRYGTQGQHDKFPEYFERRKFEKTHSYADTQTLDEGN